MINILDELNRTVGYYTESDITAEGPSPYVKSLSRWLNNGVPCLTSVIDSGVITEKLSFCTPSDPTFGLALAEYFDRLGWRVENTLAINTKCGAGGGKGKPGFQKGNSCAGGGDRKSGLKKTMNRIMAVVNTMPKLAKESAREAGASDTVIKMAYAIATIGDWAVPGVPAGSAVVMAVSTAKSPKSVYRGARNLVREFKTGGVEEPISNSEKFDQIIQHAVNSPDQESWMLYYLAATDENSSHQQALSIADQLTIQVRNDTSCGAGGGKGRPGFQKGNTCAGGAASKRGSVKTKAGETLQPIKRVGKEWQYEDDSPVEAHIQKAGIPPAWKNVYVNKDPNGTVLAKGEDAKGRIQMKYSASHNAKAAAAKFGRVTELRMQRKEIFKELDEDAKDPATRDQAHCLKVVMQTGMRPGSTTDTKADYKSYGATTLEGRHVVDNKDGTVTLRLVTGKNKGREVDFPVTDKATAKMLLRRAATSGPDGKLFNTTADSLRTYSKGKGGGGFKTKDHRTALGTETAIRKIKELGNKKQFTNMKEYKAAVKEVATAVSDVLGNTPAIALTSYIDPTVFAGWRFPAAKAK